MKSVVCIARGGMTFMVPGTLPVNNFREFVDYAKRNPGKLNFSYTAGSILLSAEMLRTRTGFEATAIPYKGSTQVATALIAGEIQMGIDVPFFYLGIIKEGRIKALAHGGQARSPSLPDVPTLAEVGVPDLVFAFSYGIWVPAATPEPIVAKLNAAFNEVLKDLEIRQRLAPAGVVPVGGAPSVHSQQVAGEQQMWAQAAKQGLQARVMGERPMFSLAGKTVVVTGVGSIVNISSRSASYPNPGTGHYGAAKAALENLTRTMAAEWGHRRIRVNAVAPGVVMTDELALTLNTESRIRRQVETVPLPRLGTPDDIGPLCAYRVSDEAAWTSGALIAVNGGSFVPMGYLSYLHHVNQQAR